MFGMAALFVKKRYLTIIAILTLPLCIVVIELLIHIGMREGATALLLALVCMHSARAMCAVAGQSRTHKASSDAAVPQQLNPGPAVAETLEEQTDRRPLRCVLGYA